MRNGTGILANHTPIHGAQLLVPSVAVHGINNHDGIGAGSDVYKMHSGDGSAFPPKEQWISFDAMFNQNKPILSASCAQFGQPDNSKAEIKALYDSIQLIAQETKVDHRFILAITMQESGGCVRAPTTNWGVRNPGIMQCHNGDGTCNNDRTGKAHNPCPSHMILQMMQDGVAGTKHGDGLVQSINKSGDKDTRAYYRGARIYNSGSLHISGILEAPGSTRCYVSDIANRLTGWVKAERNCLLG
ncbi:MAG: hypothetical protein M1814_002861 [Vezdaea aestivalis]|nr:MAG: hypothetical protein M1814_002861 [Vezdaea aestivalis]